MGSRNVLSQALFKDVLSASPRLKETLGRLDAFVSEIASRLRNLVENDLRRKLLELLELVLYASPDLQAVLECVRLAIFFALCI